MTSPGGGKPGGKSTTIGYATLQLIPSLKGVTEAIEQQIDGKVVEVKVTPKVDQRAAEDAGRQTKAAVEKQTADVKVTPKADTRAAEQAGKAAGDAVAKGANDAVAKGDIGKTVSDEVTKTVAKSSPGKDLAKIIVDGLASGAKDELRGGPLGDVLVDGLAEGVKQGIDNGTGRQIIKTVSDAVKAGNLGGSVKDAVLPGIKQIGTDIRAGATEWSKGVADALRGGDIQGATENIGSKVRNTTALIAGIGSTFGLQLDGVRDFGNGSATTLETVGGDVQDILNKASDMKSSFVDTGELLGNVLPGRAGAGAQKILNSLGSIIPVAGAVYDALDRITSKWHADQEERFWERNEADRRAIELGVKPPQPGVGDIGGAPAVGQGDAPKRPPLPNARVDLRAQVQAGNVPGFSIGPNGQIVDRDGKPVNLPGFDFGGYTGAYPIDKIAGVVHGKEFVVNALSQQSIENDHPGLLDYMNKTGKLPGYAGGGLVAGTAELRQMIGQRFGISNIGGWRPEDKYGEHSTGRALDVMVGDKSKGDAVRDFALANADAIDLKWVIWRQHLYYPGGGGYDMPDRGSPTQNHMDHVHIFSGTGISNGLRGALKGGGRTVTVSAPALAGPDPTGISAPDQTAATASSDVSPASSSSAGGGGFSLPSSLSGLAATGLSDLGVTTQATPNSPERTFEIGNAAGSAVTGQVQSALGVFGVNDSPGWLQGISKFVGGLSISDASGNKIFGGSGASAIGGLSPFGKSAPGGYGGAEPSAASSVGVSAPAPAVGNVHGAAAGQQPGPVFHTQISAFDTSDALAMWDRKKNELVAAKTSRF